MIDRLANGDIIKHKEIYDQNFIYCLSLLGLWWYRDKEIEEQNKINEMKNKHRR